MDRKIQNMVIVDNSIVSFYCNLNNGIYIPSFKGNPLDNELYFIEEFLMKIKDTQDVRTEIKDKFKIEERYSEYLNQ